MAGQDRTAELDLDRRLGEGPWHVAVDFDGVLFDQARHVREGFVDVYGIEIGPAETWPADLTEHPPVREAGLDAEDTWEVFHRVHNDPAAHDTEPMDADARRVLAELLDAGHRVDVVTARSPESRANTETFLERNEIPHRELVMGAREKTGYDVLVDDLPVHVRRAAGEGGLGLLMDQPYNRAFEADGNPRRVADWAGVERLLGATDPT